jgi:WD40 repeat protein
VLPDAPAWYPAWSPDGSWLSVTGGQDGQALLYRLPPDGRDLLPLSDANLSLTTSDWSPDSAWLAFSTRGEGGPDDLFVMDAAGQYRFRLTQHDAADYDPDWRPVQAACLVVSSDEDVYVYVGPGRYRGAFGLLPPHQSFLVQGQARDADGNLWWKLDKTQIPDGEMANSLWVAAEDVTESGDCVGAPQVEVPPVIVRITPTPPRNEWGECGSCQTCGHPASECVLSPGGQCLWDPQHCGQTEQTCYIISTSAVGPGVVSVLTATNCEGGYTPGTAVSVLGTPTSVTHQGVLDHWEGTCPGATGSANPVTVTMNFSCTVIGYFR